ncbi:MAG: restriction endonuclease subunit S, partial [Xanthomonadaceae bacterium]|nr:restriction endonuclease subunit S [Xanthomonadaceae bacterium]
MAKRGAKGVVPRLRFPGFRRAGRWAEVPLGKIADRIATKNGDGRVTRVLTNSAEFGVLDQRDYFDKDIATAGKTDGYYIVGKGDYVYNPRTSTAAPVGPISRNDLGEGVMSPLYTVFRFSVHETDFYQHYFKSVGWHSYLRSAASTGARHDRMSITTGAFMRMPVPVPSREEQQKIADCLTSLDEVIAAQSQKVEALKAHKRGLMQQLFPREGETRPR